MKDCIPLGVRYVKYNQAKTLFPVIMSVRMLYNDIQGRTLDSRIFKKAELYSSDILIGTILYEVSPIPNLRACSSSHIRVFHFTAVPFKSSGLQCFAKVETSPFQKH